MRQANQFQACFYCAVALVSDAYVISKMNKEDIAHKLDDTLQRLKMDTATWADLINNFREKLELLFDAGNYNKLFKALFSSNELNEFNSYVFEVLFAHDFQSKNQSLLYEVKQLSDSDSSIDFVYKIDNQKTIYFELRLVKQRRHITNSIKSQLNMSKSFEILLNGEDEKDDTVRIQNLILSKCQKDDGPPVKFSEPKEGLYNFIVINLSEIHLGMVDRYDCILSMYGDSSVPPHCRRDIFGMWQSLSDNPSDKEKEFYDKFKHFRDTIHGTLFVRYVKNSGILDGMYIDRELEYFMITNSNLIKDEEYNSIEGKLSSFLKAWQNE